ncbi:hypothetical protein Bcell_1541 [Evansella cellulosilytica DSM 2522]|uniref:Uncharacterized protein n=2 Tax=Evansella TaxID=2837485 RepID=E6TVC0_EVAC2|nr:hypothetical protein Bcell_1541 [Evansella cellulosilytica DSM 2522]
MFLVHSYTFFVALYLPFYYVKNHHLASVVVAVTFIFWFVYVTYTFPIFFQQRNGYSAASNLLTISFFEVLIWWSIVFLLLSSILSINLYSRKNWRKLAVVSYMMMMIVGSVAVLYIAEQRVNEKVVEGFAAIEFERIDHELKQAYTEGDESYYSFELIVVLKKRDDRLAEAGVHGMTVKLSNIETQMNTHHFTGKIKQMSLSQEETHYYVSYVYPNHITVEEAEQMISDIYEGRTALSLISPWGEEKLIQIEK